MLVRKHDLDWIARSPQYWRYMFDNSVYKGMSPDRTMQEAVRDLIFQPSKVPQKYAVHEDFNLQRKADQFALEAFKMKNPGMLYISKSGFKSAQRITKLIQNHPAGSKLTATGEKDIKAQFEKFSIKCEAKIPFLNTDVNYIVDIQLVDNASDEEFSKYIVKKRLHVHAAFFLDGIFRTKGFVPEHYIFIAAEKKEPFGINIKSVPADVRNLGDKIYQKNVLAFIDGVDTGIWKSYGDKITPLELPGWAYKV